MLFRISAALLALSPVVAARPALAADSIADREQRIAAAQQAEDQAQKILSLLQVGSMALASYMIQRSESVRSDDASRLSMTGFRGVPVVIPTEFPDVYKVRIVDERDGRRLILADYLIGSQGIEAAEVHERGKEPVAGVTESLMARLGFDAMAEMRRVGFEICGIQTQLPDGTMRIESNQVPAVFWPDDAGQFDVYVLNLTRQGDSVPLGGFYRMTYSDEGELVDTQALGDGCHWLDLNVAEPGWQDHPLTIETASARSPGIAHVLVSAFLPMELDVVTDDAVWPLLHGEIGDPVALTGRLP